MKFCSYVLELFHADNGNFNGQPAKVRQRLKTRAKHATFLSRWTSVLTAMKTANRESRIALHNKNSTTRCGRFFYTRAADLWTTVSVCGEWTPWTSPFLCLSNPIGCGTLHQLPLHWPGVGKVEPRDKIQSGLRWNSVIDKNPLLRAPQHRNLSSIHGKGKKIFVFSKKVRTEFGIRPASSSVDTGSTFPEG